MEQARLGLIGDNIAASQAPRLHALAGALQRDRGTGTTCWSRPSSASGSTRSSIDARTGATTVSTSPIRTRRRAAARVEIENPLVRAMGAVNLVRFESGSAAWASIPTTRAFSRRLPREVRDRSARHRSARWAPAGRERPIGFALAELGADVDPDRGHRPRPGASAGGGASGGTVRGMDTIAACASLEGSGRGGARSRQLLSARHDRPRWHPDSAPSSCRVRRGRSTCSLYPGPHAISGRCGGGRARHLERLRALLPPGSGRPGNLLRRIGRPDPTSAGAGSARLRISRLRSRPGAADPLFASSAGRHCARLRLSRFAPSGLDRLTSSQPSPRSCSSAGASTRARNSSPVSQRTSQSPMSARRSGSAMQANVPDRCSAVSGPNRDIV